MSRSKGKAAVAATDRTPGRPSILTIRSAWKSAIRCRSRYAPVGRSTRRVRTLEASKPGVVSSNSMKLRDMSPAPTTSITATATCATTSRPRTRSRPFPAEDPRAPSWSAPRTSVRAKRSTGARPKSSPVKQVVKNVTSRTRPFIVTSSSRGRSSGPNATNRFMPPAARKLPRTAPTAASTRLSVRSWRARRARPAPNAVRRAISGPRSAMRDSSRLMTFTHATSINRPVAPNSTNKVVRVSPTMAS